MSDNVILVGNEWNLEHSERIYLAARYSRRDEIQQYKKILEDEGFYVTSTWLEDVPEHEQDITDMAEAADRSIPISVRPLAETDVADVLRSDTLVFFSEPPVSTYARGGRHVEFGLALGLARRIIVVGPRENIFHTLGCVEHFTCWGQEVIDALKNKRDNL